MHGEIQACLSQRASFISDHMNFYEDINSLNMLLMSFLRSDLNHNIIYAKYRLPRELCCYLIWSAFIPFLCMPGIHAMQFFLNFNPLSLVCIVLYD